MALMVSVDGVPPLVTGFGLKLALVLCGKPLTLKVTELGSLTAATVTGVDLFEPRLTVSEDAADTLKSGGLVDPPAVKEAIAVLQLKLNRMLFRE